MKKILFLLTAVVLNCLVGGTLSACVGVSPMIGAAGLNAVAAIAPLFGGMEGTLRAGLYSEIWTGETIKAFRNSVASLGWLTKIRAFDSQVANNNTINFVDLGGDPTVLVNNTSYPIGVETLSDANKAIGLDKYQTRATKITDDEARGLSYDKMGSVIERHRDVVDTKKYARAIHALAPASNTNGTPVLTTTGPTDGTRKRLVVADLIALKKQFDDLKVPVEGRILVLCSEHVNDLLLQDTTFAQRYNNHTTGAIANQYGFEIYEYVDCPQYNASTKAKLAFGAVPAAATDRNASVAFYAPRMMKATGETKAYVDEPDTQNQEWRYNLRHYFICLPLKNEAIGAIVSAIASAPAVVTPVITSADTVTLGATAQIVKRTVSISTGAEWTVAKADDTDTWIDVEKDGSKVKITVVANDAQDAVSRTADYIITCGAVTKTVTVTQGA